jgi:acetyltransferase-like isoleucine patch superfamily enzyme
VRNISRGNEVIEVSPGLNSEFLSRDALEALGFARLGEDVLIHSTAVIVDCNRISFGSRIRIDPYVIISTRGGALFGNNIHIGGHSVLAGQAAIHFEDFVNISHYVGIYTSNAADGRALSYNPTVAPGFGAVRTASITFGRHSAVGALSVVFPGARFAEGSALGAMSRVGRPLKPWTLYAGVPARRMRDRPRDVLLYEPKYLASLKK